MKKLLPIIILLFVFSNKSFSQVDIAAGMGINLVYAPSLNDYLSFNWATDELADFSTAIEFYGEADYSVFKNFQIGVEYVYVMWNYNYSSLFGSYSLEYAHIKPSVLLYYVIAGEGYKFKFGGGLGVRGVKLTEKSGTTISTGDTFSVIGVGILGRIQAHTRLSGNFYATIGGTVRYDAPGDPTADESDNPLYNPVIKKAVNLNSFSASLDLGVAYFF